MPTPLGAHRVIQELRVELFRRHINAAGIAKAAGVSYSSVSRRFNGEVATTLDELDNYAAAAGMVVEVRFVDDRSHRPPTTGAVVIGSSTAGGAQ